MKLLGEGGMGAVFLAEHTLIKRRVAIKILHPHLATDAHVVDCFMNEARAAGMLGHPNIVESTDMGFTAEHVPYIVFEYLEGALLTDEIYRVGGLPARRAVRIAESIAHALRAAHDAGIVHRDLKSDNIFLTDRDEVSDHVKVLDFGISRFLQEDKQRGVVMGTPEFMAPEQLAHPESVDHRADIYALGAMLYEMLAARRIFVPSKEPIELQSQILVEPVPPLNRSDVPPGLIALIEQMLSKDPAQRPQTMGAVALALDTYLTREDGTPVPRRRSQPIPTVKGADDIARDSSTIPRPTGTLNTPVPSSGTPQRIATPMPVKSRPPYGLFAVAGLGLAVGGLGLAFGLRSASKDDVAATPPPAPAPAPAASMPAPPPVPKEPPRVQIEIDSDVANAHVVFRRRVAPAPMTTESAASEIVELVEISAPGYKTERYWVTMDRATHLKAHLVKGSGMAEATEEETLVALGEVAAPTKATATAAAKTVEHAAPAAAAATVVASAPAAAPAAATPTPRKVGRSAAAEADEIASVKTEKPTAGPAHQRVEPAIASVAPPVEAPALPPAPPPPAAPVDLPKPAAAPAVAVQQPAVAAAPAEAPRLIAPGVLKSLRVSGGDQIDAPDLVQAQMVRDEHKKTSATVKVCVAAGGEVSSASMLKSSGYPAFDERILSGVRAFRYKSYTVEGRAVPVCSAVMFVYKI